MSRNRVFISYSHKDKRWLDRVQAHLLPLVRAKQVDLWSDTRSGPGKKWNDEIEAALTTARVAVLLVSANFVNSEFIMKAELPVLVRAARRGDLALLWVLLSPCVWENTELGAFQAVNDTSRPLGALSDAEAETELVQLAKHVLRELGSGVAKVVEPLLFTVAALDNADPAAFDLLRKSGLPDRAIHAALAATPDLPGLRGVAYRTERSPAGVVVAPVFPYRDLLRRGGPVPALSFAWIPFAVPLPALDLRVVNNTSKTVFIDAAVFEVAESRPDREPIPVIEADEKLSCAGYFYLQNEGWGAILEPTLRFKFLRARGASDRPRRVAGPFAHEMRLPRVKDGVKVDFTAALGREGVDWAALESLQSRSRVGSGPDARIEVHGANDATIVLSGREYDRRRAVACGPFPEGHVDVLGEMSYRWKEGRIANDHAFRFFSRIALYDHGLRGRPAPPSATYSVKLDVQGRNYARRIPLSHVLQPTEADRFLINVGLDASSSYRFVIRLCLSSGETIASEPIALDAFVPRSMIQFLR